MFFTTPIPVGTPTPAINAASTLVGGITTSLTQFKFCLTADAGTNVVRTFADYCVYTNLLGSTLPTKILIYVASRFFSEFNLPG